MAFREVAVTKIREVLRAWLSGAGLRQVAERAGVDRKTARRYVEAAVAAGLARDGGPAQLTDELIGQVAQVVWPVRDRRIAVSYTVEALRIFDHYLSRVLQSAATKAKRFLALAKPPRQAGEVPWWQEDYTDARKIRDRKLFS